MKPCIVNFLNSYSFENFTIEKFARDISQQTGYEICMIPMSLEDDTGAWIRIENLSKDYVFYEESLNGFHRTHAILHELGHIVCGHETTTIDSDDLVVIQRVIDLALKRNTTVAKSPDEIEAEEFAFSIAREVRECKLSKDIFMGGRYL